MKECVCRKEREREKKRERERFRVASIIINVFNQTFVIVARTDTVTIDYYYYTKLVET